MNMATPLRLAQGSDWCFGWWHAPEGPARALSVVLCPPIGYEAVFSYPTQVQLARHLAGLGLPVLRFDYHGTGDSAGEDTQPGRVDAWIDSVQRAVAEARRRSGHGAVALLGIRLGAALAVEAAARLGGVDSLLLWAPCPTGRSFLREMRAAGEVGEDGSLHAFGHHFSQETVRDLDALDARKPACRPAQRALVVMRDDMAVAGPLPGALRAAGVDVHEATLEGYAAMVSGEPGGGVLQASALDELAGWLLASPAALPAPSMPAGSPPCQAVARIDAVLERTVFVGPQQQLVGVLAEPAVPDEQRRRTGVILLNIGANYRIGPHRFYVKTARALAAAGWRTLRLDLAGIGDSPPQPGKPWASLYDRDATQDVRHAMDALAAQGCRDFVLMGACSGSYVAFQTAQADPRVGGLVLMNSRLLEWQPGQPGDRWQDSMQRHAKSTDYYLKAAFTREPWQRLLRGQINVRLIASRFADVARARLERLVAGPAKDTLLGRMQALCRRGCDVLMLVSDADDGRDYVEFHFGAAGRRMREQRNFEMRYVASADHTFSRPGNQAQVVPMLLARMEQRMQSPPGRARKGSPPAAEARAAPT
ncbi:alpha/beta fold hydrolase [Ramlibacter rhizophilus]|nr:alpha/beta fold hydrolase [Ramlibacter rhizophilus]